MERISGAQGLAGQSLVAAQPELAHCPGPGATGGPQHQLVGPLVQKQDGAAVGLEDVLHRVQGQPQSLLDALGRRQQGADAEKSGRLDVRGRLAPILGQTRQLPMPGHPSLLLVRNQPGPVGGQRQQKHPEEKIVKAGCFPTQLPS
jgi:hypothetical protein